ncbi:interleukin-12 subunit beta [Brachyhypopomus gauderio]|uniref:interleukin-12 subunit beta n=1 Tax=Brachyhypopomus gauderio TaxID=698409 RepID=UPI0040437C7D
MTFETQSGPALSQYFFSQDHELLESLDKRTREHEFSKLAASNTPQHTREMRHTLNIISLLCLCTMKVSDTFPDKLIVGKSGGSVTLRCPPATEPTVTWKHDNTELPQNETTLTFTDFDTDLTGNFTCWKKDEFLDYTYILLDMSHEQSLQITCTAETLNCSYNISCRMNNVNIPNLKVFRLRYEWDDNGWVLPSEDGTFHLTHFTNPYAEEHKRLKVVGEAMSLNYYYTSRYDFYLRDIIKPGCPTLSVAKGVIDLSPPGIWPSPPSYYPLENEIQCEWRSNGERSTCRLDSGAAVPEDVSMLRVRCRDPLLLSQWSEWTPWQNVGRRRQKKNREKGQRVGKKGHHNRKQTQRVGK